MELFPLYLNHESKSLRTRTGVEDSWRGRDHDLCFYSAGLISAYVMAWKKFHFGAGDGIC
jgi:hypothetical protein